jgi:hypothetical protein
MSLQTCCLLLGAIILGIPVVFLCSSSRGRLSSDITLWLRCAAWCVIVIGLPVLGISYIDGIWFYDKLGQPNQDRFYYLVFWRDFGIGVGLGLLLGVCAGGVAIYERHHPLEPASPPPSTLPEVGERWSARSAEKPQPSEKVQPGQKDVTTAHAGTDA